MSERILTKRRLLAVASALPVLSAFASARAQGPQDVVLTNVSYDPTRELYKEINEAFARQWKAETGEKVTVRASHGGSGKQARSVIDGLEADVVTLALAADIDAIAASRKRLPENWQSRLPQQLLALHLDHRVPGAQGQPEGHQGLGRPRQAGRPGRSRRIPKTSGGARWNYLAAWAYALDARTASDEASGARSSSRRSIKNVPVLDTGARGSTTTFAQRGIGDVLLAWENEAFLILQEFGADKFEIVVPSLSILAEPPVALVDADRRQARHAQGGRGLSRVPLHAGGAGDHRQATSTARASPMRPIPPTSTRFPKLKLVTIDEVFGGWAQGAGRALRRRRHLRPDLQAVEQAGDAMSDAALSGWLPRVRKPSALPGFGLTLRLHPRLPVADRPDPARRAGRARAGALGLDGIWRVATDAARAGGAARSASASRPPRRWSTPSSACSSPGCWCATTFPASACSTRWSTCRSRCRRRSPASRSPRSTPPNGWIGALLAPLGHQGRLHAARHRRRAGLHRPALRRAHGAAGAAGPRPRGRGGRGDARRHAARRPCCRVVLPPLLPALLTGFALAFARAVGEYGSVIFIAGNMPYVSEIAPLLIVIKLEEFDYAGADGDRHGHAGDLLR